MKHICPDNLLDFAFVNFDTLEYPVRGIFFYLHGYTDATMFTQSNEMAALFGKHGIAWVFPYYSVWAWMSRSSQIFNEQVLDAVYERLGVDDTVPLMIGGGSMGGLTALITGSMFTTTAAQVGGSAMAIVLAAVFPTVLANLVQVYAQPHVDANKAAVIYTLEAVFATVISILMGMEPLRTSVIVGGGLIACAVLLTQVGGSQDA